MLRRELRTGGFGLAAMVGNLGRDGKFFVRVPAEIGFDQLDLIFAQRRAVCGEPCAA
jgi:hypothetical protein